jgi:ribulose-bisphosphate carboxylase large chain
VARLLAIYHIRCDARSIDARAQTIAVEQSVEMPLAAIDDEHVLSEIVGRVESVRDIGGGWFEARISLATATIGRDAGQLVNMLFGNTSIHDDVTLHDAEIPDDVIAGFGGPRHGLDGLRQRVGAGQRALTCSALKPQGLPPAKLADIAHRFAIFASTLEAASKS